ncbi:hypothetical protein HGM15179_003247 [Zosterops borbonicus]|uniref:Uncharacterized protein n=1 Tax=Zosterops borbonicus TaxID=364589 RepID=A0A8K1GRE7_9PASS|nr:hypothetical protein HGM15179_003247 [Zosterops borbonicus]
MGPDGRHLRVTKELIKETTKPFLIIYQQSWLTRDVPSEWKLANIIYKNSQKEDTENHRPAMLTSVPEKDMEHIIFDTNSHSILLEKLADRGLDGCILYWVENWPDVQRVVRNGVISSWQPVINRVLAPPECKRPDMAGCYTAATWLQSSAMPLPPARASDMYLF